MKDLYELNKAFALTFSSLTNFEKNMTSGYKNYNLSISEVHLLEEISNMNNATLNAIASALNIKPPSVTISIKKLELKGMIIKVPNNDDNRSTIVHLTDIGKKIVKSHEWFHRKMLYEISKSLATEEIDTLIRGLNSVNNFLKAVTPKEK